MVLAVFFWFEMYCNVCRDHEMFQQIRAVIQQNPNMLSTMLQQIGQSNPQLLQIISQVC